MSTRAQHNGPALFQMEDFFAVLGAPETVPAIAYPRELFSCGVHRRHGEETPHLIECLHNVCPSCHDEIANAFLLDLNHTGLESGMCESLGLRLNHLTVAIRAGRLPSENDLSALANGWLIGPEGTQIPVDGQPRRSEWAGRHRQRETFAEWVSTAFSGKQKAVAA